MLDSGQSDVEVGGLAILDEDGDDPAGPSAGRGCRVELPFASEAARPIDHWKPPAPPGAT